jgi:hypothetical protein
MIGIDDMARKKPIRELINGFIESPIIFMAGPVGFVLLLLGASFLFEDPQPAPSKYDKVASFDAGHTASQTESHDADVSH